MSESGCLENLCSASSGLGPISVLTVPACDARLVMPTALRAVSARRAAPPTQNGGNSKQKRDAGSDGATWPCVVEDMPRATAVLSGPRAQVTWNRRWILPPITRKSGDGSRPAQPNLDIKPQPDLLASPSSLLKTALRSSLVFHGSALLGHRPASVTAPVAMTDERDRHGYRF